MLLEELMEKVESYCNERDMIVKNFVTDHNRKIKSCLQRETKKTETVKDIWYDS
jgi:hypothetical protein